jgi:DNA (cytosine-5)-methyltransferase 1
MKLISLFSGIGGFELAGEWAGWQNVVSCEINPFGRKVLEYYWPNAYHHDDIKTLTFEKIDYELTQRFGAKWNANDIILTGGFPCQPYSAAGKRLGKEDERHLWPEMCRIIREVQPKWVVGENVLGLVNWSGGLVFEEVQADLESEGYEIQPYVLPAASVNAPHKRDRVWFVAYKNATDTDHNGYATTKNGQGLGEGNDPNKTGQNDAIEFEGRAVSDGVTENTLCSGRIQRKPEQEGSEIREQRNACPGDSIGVCGAKVAGVTPDTDNVRLQQCKTPRTLGEGQKEIFGQGHKPSMRIKTNECFGNAPDTESKGSWGELQQRQGKGQFGRQNSRNEHIPNWKNFPTKSPICTGNDGLPTELDGITFSKWRNESIKAGGNAIVPQVVYQIFKAINEYQTNIQKP